MASTVERKDRTWYQISYVLAHNEIGLAERSIREIKKLFNKVFSGMKLTDLGYETAFAWIATALNNIPLCLGSSYVDYDRMDLITPSRLILGRNVDRACHGPSVLGTLSEMKQQQLKIADAWQKAWTDQVMQKFIPRQSKWQKSDEQLPEKGDICIFQRTETSLGGPTYRIGRVRHAETAKDGLNRTLTLEYKNSGEKVFRTTTRNPRQVAVLHHEHEVGLTEQLNQAAKRARLQFLKNNKEDQDKIQKQPTQPE